MVLFSFLFSLLHSSKENRGEKLFDSIQPIVQFLHDHPHGAGLFTFFIVFCEALAVVGVVVPGSITMTAIGVMVGTGVLSASHTFAWAIAGAILGDCISYFVGVHYKDRLHRIWPFNKHPQWLTKSEKFFHHHGGKSVFLGRFIGPMRAMTPMVAGMLNMSVTRFLFAAIPSVSLWAILYLVPGIFLGVLSTELPPKIATEFVLGVLGLIILIWFMAWLIKHFFTQIYRALEKVVWFLWNWMAVHDSTRWLTKFLSNGNSKNEYQQLLLLFRSFLALIIFFIILFSVVHHGILTFLNEPIFYFLRSFRGPRLDFLMIVITILGDYKVILGAAGIFVLWLLYKKERRLAFYYILLFILSEFAVTIFKSLQIAMRPGSFMGDFGSSSFPSGHAVFSCVFFGFWAILLARTLIAEQRWIPYVGSGVLVFLIIFSRLYLGAHWITDVVAGVAIGWAIVLATVVFYSRKSEPRLNIKRAYLIAISIYLVLWLGYAVSSMPKQVVKYEVRWPATAITLSEWQAHNKSIPWYRAGRLGEPIQIFNVQWLGELNAIKNDLVDSGWQVQPVELDFRGMINCLFGDSVYRYFPLLPQLYHNRVPVLIVTKAIEDNNVLSLELWQSDINIDGNTSPLWLGAVHYNPKMPRIFAFHKPKSRTKFFGAVDLLRKDLSGFKLQEFEYALSEQPEEVRELNWNGKLLLISPIK